MSECKRCETPLLSVSAKCSDRFSLRGGGINHGGYVPKGIGLGDNGDYVRFSYCPNCGQMGGAWPLETPLYITVNVILPGRGDLTPFTWSRLTEVRDAIEDLVRHLMTSGDPESLDYYQVIDSLDLDHPDFGLLDPRLQSFEEWGIQDGDTLTLVNSDS